ncbi:MAG: cell division protein FtsL [Deltaproteobacteria bacterium RBG_19FT_COMBO_58_16]|jgi:cell division protein FtsL|nr:MAG: cell division protein FtsL [Deltaproteobacteria bacterium RBG_19FT_COMBO_58_16]
MSQTVTKKMGFTGVLTGQDVRVRRDLRDLSFLYFSVLSAFVLVCVALVFLWSRMTVVNTGYEISKANTARAALIDRNKRLRLEFMKLKSPERVEKIASKELGLVHPTGEQIVNIR